MLWPIQHLLLNHLTFVLIGNKKNTEDVDSQYFLTTIVAVAAEIINEGIAFDS
jgi:NADH:ubiquinone oxidoreductase subunit K